MYACICPPQGNQSQGRFPETGTVEGGGVDAHVVISHARHPFLVLVAIQHNQSEVKVTALQDRKHRCRYNQHSHSDKFNTPVMYVATCDRGIKEVEGHLSPKLTPLTKKGCP